MVGSVTVSGTPSILDLETVWCPYLLVDPSESGLEVSCPIFVHPVSNVNRCFIDVYKTNKVKTKNRKCQRSGTKSKQSTV